MHRNDHSAPDSMTLRVEITPTETMLVTLSLWILNVLRSAPPEKQNAHGHAMAPFDYKRATCLCTNRLVCAHLNASVGLEQIAE